MPYDSKEKHNAYARKQKQGLYQRRKDLLSQWPCSLCGDPDDSVIQWHHVEPEEKSFSLCSGAHSEARWWDEVLKCIPVCANCHIKIHKNKLCLLPMKR